MKKIIYLVLTLFLVFAFVACSNQPAPEKKSMKEKVAEEQAETDDWNNQLDIAEDANYKIYKDYGYEFDYEEETDRYIPKEGQDFQYYVQKAISDGIKSAKIADDLYVYI